jgi:hypothetical protein
VRSFGQDNNQEQGSRKLSLEASLSARQAAQPSRCNGRLQASLRFASSAAELHRIGRRAILGCVAKELDTEPHAETAQIRRLSFFTYFIWP